MIKQLDPVTHRNVTHFNCDGRVMYRAHAWRRSGSYSTRMENSAVSAWAWLKGLK